MLTSCLTVDRKLIIIVVQAAAVVLKSTWGLKLPRYERLLLHGKLDTLVEAHWEELAMMKVFDFSSKCISSVLHDC
jgi:hypothetical protein